MKKIFISTLIFAYSLICVNTNASNYIDESSNEPKIGQMVVNIPSFIKIFPADTFGINIRTKDIDIYKSIKYEIKNNVIYIDTNDKQLIDEQLIDPDDIRINIQVPNDIKIKTNNYMLVAEAYKNSKAANNEKN